MSDNVSGGYPAIPAKAWWELRSRFKKSIPGGEVNAAFVGTVLSMQDNSALNNVVRPLQRIGLLDESGKVTPLGRRWREDDEYADVCGEIISAVYPQALLDVSPPEDFNSSAATSWFSKTTGGGESAVGKQVSFYRLLCERDPQGASSSGRKNSEITPKTRNARSVGVNQKRSSKSNSGSIGAVREPEMITRDELKGVANGSDFQVSSNERAKPTIHINIQVHISSDAGPDQVEAIFSSMAKHLYSKSNNG